MVRFLFPKSDIPYPFAEADADDTLARERESMMMEQPSERNYMSLIHFLWNHKPIAYSEMKFAEKKNDFVRLSKERQSWFHEQVEDFIARYSPKWLQVRKGT